MFKNQLQEVAQRSCFNLPSYTCIREGPDHAPRFKAVVNFNGESFDSPNFCSTLRFAEGAAAETALISLSSRGPSHSLDETGVYKNLLHEIARRVRCPLPRYTTYTSGLGHVPVFTGTVQLAGITFQGEAAKNKKQAEKNAALAAWVSLKQLAQKDAGPSPKQENKEEQEKTRIARFLRKYRMKQKIHTTNSIIRFWVPTPPRPSIPDPEMSASKILPLFTASGNTLSSTAHTQWYPVYAAAPYVYTYTGIVRRAVPVFSAPPVRVRQPIPVFSCPPPSEKLQGDSTCQVDESIAIKCLEQLEI